MRGRLDEHVFTSDLLAETRSATLHERPLWVYTAAGLRRRPHPTIRAVYVIQGFTGQLDMWRNRAPFRPTFPEQVDELFADGQTPPCSWSCSSTAGHRWAAASTSTRPATGRYHSYLCDEVVAWVDAHYRTLAAPRTPWHRRQVERRLRRDGHADAAARSVGRPGHPRRRRAVRGLLRPRLRALSRRLLRDGYDGSYDRFLADFREPAPLHQGRRRRAARTTARMAACYSADDDGTVRLPFDPATGELIPEVWGRWLALDPVRMVPRPRRDAALDAGDLHRCRHARRVVPRSGRRGVPGRAGGDRRHDVRFELFDATHMNIGYRYPISLRYLAERLS